MNGLNPLTAENAEFAEKNKKESLRALRQKISRNPTNLDTPL